jgi:methionyl-tRNA formyltransferase
MAVKYLPLYFDGKLTGVQQDASQVTFCPSIKKEEEHLLLTQTPDQFVNQVRSLSLTPGGYLLNPDGTILKIYQAEKAGEENKAPLGTVLLAQKDQVVLQVQGGTVRLLNLQKPGKRAMSALDFNNGTRNFAGTVLQ